MPWKQLSSWHANAVRARRQPPMPLTLVTLSGRADATAEEFAFYADAEFQALVAWAEAGRFVMAFAAIEQQELTLVCPGSIQSVTTQVQDLPLVAAGLAKAQIRAIQPLRLTRRGRMAH